MNKELFVKIKDTVKKPKVLVLCGIAGIAFIFISSLLPTKKERSLESESVTAKEYQSQITESVKEIVSSISGDKKPTVVVTLESGARYSYADAGEENTVSTSGTGTEQNSEIKKRSYVTVKDSSGGEKALLVSETMPQIRGVAIICDSGDDTDTSEKIKNAVKAALNISEKRVYVSGGNINEKR